ncbi:MAG: SDR family NAD(P)-dependent oxidoreductase [Pseudomonadota bacterium]
MDPNTLFSLQGKIALVTGGATGIGYMAATGLVMAGARVLIASRKGAACEDAAAALNALDAPGSAEGFAADLSTEAGIDALLVEVKARTDKLHILMNNSGVSWGAPLGQFPYDAWDKVMALNVTAAFHLTQALLPTLIATAKPEDPARVINVGSVMGDAPLGDGAYSYAASKAAVHHITEIMAKELASHHVTVNALAPGPFVSKMTAFATADEGMRAKVGADVPLGRVGQPEDIAGCMQFLCGQGGSYLTGAILPVSGGIQVMSGPNLFRAALEG